MLRLGIVLALVLPATACDESITPLLTVTHPGGTLDGGEVWSEAVHVLEGSIYVEGGPLVVPACSTIQMPTGATIKVRNGGSFELIGRADCPITVTSAQAVPAPGDWHQLEIESDASNSNTLDWVILEYGGGSSYGSLWMDSDTHLSMTNSTVRHSGHAGLRLYDGAHFDAFTNNTLVDNAEGALHLFASAAGDLGVGVYGPNDIDGIILEGGTVSSDASWLPHDAPYVMESAIIIDGGSGSAQLTVEAGAVIEVGQGLTIKARNNGGLTLAGTSTAPVTITSAKPVPAPGDWYQIELENDSVGAYNDFDYAVIEYGGGSSYGQIWLDTDASLAMTNTIVRDSGDTGLRLYDGAEVRDFTGNTIINNAEGPLEIFANYVDGLGQGTYSPNGIDGVRILGGTLDHDCTWLALDAPYIVEGRVIADGGAGGSARLTVAAGATIEMGLGQVIDMRTNSGLTLDGTANEHVTVTSSAAVPAAGDWYQIELKSSSVAAYNQFNYTDIMYGGGSAYGQVWLDSAAGLTIDNVVFSNAGDGGTPDGCDIRVYSGGTLNATASTYTLCNP